MSTYNSSILLRVNSREKIQEDYISKTLEFSCPANWISYAYNRNNHSVGDCLECVFAHVKDYQCIINDLKDQNGNSLLNNLHVIPTKQETYCLRFETDIMSPSLCFFNLDLLKESKKSGVNLKNNEYLMLDINEYLTMIEYEKRNSSFLVIEDVAAFINELKMSIPIAVSQSLNLTSDRYYTPFDPRNPLIYNLVEYRTSDDHELFNNYKLNYSAIFTKSKKYENQSELRFVIPNISFIDVYNYQKTYNYKKNILKIHLPNLHNYSSIFDAAKYKYFVFSSYEECTKKFKFTVFK